MTTLAMSPTPTEFDGCRFRSKSEAMFAAAISSPTGRNYREWIYEPEFLRHDEWRPDFACPVVDRCHGRLTFVVIEYKPDYVTETYKEIVAAHFAAIEKLRFRLQCWLVCYDWFGRGANMCWLFDHRNLVEMGELDVPTIFGGSGFLNPYVLDEVKWKRFDLKK